MLKHIIIEGVWVHGCIIYCIETDSLFEKFRTCELGRDVVCSVCLAVHSPYFFFELGKSIVELTASSHCHSETLGKKLNSPRLELYRSLKGGLESCMVHDADAKGMLGHPPRKCREKDSASKMMLSDCQLNTVDI